MVPNTVEAKEERFPVWVWVLPQLALDYTPVYRFHAREQGLVFFELLGVFLSLFCEHLFLKSSINAGTFQNSMLCPCFHQGFLLLAMLTSHSVLVTLQSVSAALHSGSKYPIISWKSVLGCTRGNSHLTLPNLTHHLLLKPALSSVFHVSAMALSPTKLCESETCGSPYMLFLLALYVLCLCPIHSFLSPSLPPSLPSCLLLNMNLTYLQITCYASVTILFVGPLSH